MADGWEVGRVGEPIPTEERGGGFEVHAGLIHRTHYARSGLTGEWGGVVGANDVRLPSPAPGLAAHSSTAQLARFEGGSVAYAVVQWNSSLIGKTE